MSEKIGAVVQALRKQRSWTQKRLAEAIGVQHAQVVSEMEAGRRAVKAGELARLAEVFGVTPWAIMGGEAGKAGPRVLWRRTQEAPEEARAQEQALFLKRCGQFAFLQRLAGEGPSAALPSYPLTVKSSFEDVALWADQVRGMLNVGETPAPALKMALENEWQIKVFLMPLKGGSAATTRAECGDGILLNSQEPLWRRNYSLAHELFHLLTWDAPMAAGEGASNTPSKRMETLAEVFASRLLVPAEALVPLQAKAAKKALTWFDLITTARRLGVSTPALLWRMVNVGLLSEDAPKKFEEDPELRRLDREKRLKDAAPEPDLPPKYVFAAFKAYLSGHISIGKLAEVLETTVGRLPKVLSEYGLDLDAHAYQDPVVPS